MSRKAHPRLSTRRLTSPARGNLLVETLIAILISSMLTTVFVNMYSQVRRAATMSQSELLVGSIAQEIADQLRAMPFDYVVANGGDHTLQVNGPGTGDALFPRPLLKDTGTLDYTAGGDPFVRQGLKNELHTSNIDNKAMDDTCKVHIDATGITFVNVTIYINYVDGSGKIRKFTSTTILSQNGVTG